MSEPTFTIRKRFILGLGRWLATLALTGRESRERTKFIETLSEEVKENELMRMEILKKYCEKDDKEQPIMVENEDGTKHYKIPEGKTTEFAEEMNKYMDEDFTISGPGNIQRLKVVKSIVLDTNEKIGQEMAVDYDAWCDAFEKVEV